MSDETDDDSPTWDLTGIPENTRDLEQSTDWFAAPDRTLQRMAYAADSGLGQGVSVTLVVPGGLLSGSVINGAEYFTAVSQRFREGIAELGDTKKDETAGEYADFHFDEAAKHEAKQIEQDSQDFRDGKLKEPRYLMVRYLHLSNAYYTVPGQQSMPMGFARVLLSQVAAWSIGQSLNGVANPYLS